MEKGGGGGPFSTSVYQHLILPYFVSRLVAHRNKQERGSLPFEPADATSHQFVL